MTGCYIIVGLDISQSGYIFPLTLRSIDYAQITPEAPDSCFLFGPNTCRVINADPYTLCLAIWASLQLTWVSMFVFTQFIQVARAMTTYENMTGIRANTSLSNAFTST